MPPRPSAAKLKVRRQRQSASRIGREFKTSTKRDLAERVAYMCSLPLCRKLTVKKNAASDKSVRSGKACHIHSAGATGPRNKPGMTDAECRHFENGIWACETCAREIDDNASKYTAPALRRWKKDAEDYVEGLVTQDTRLRQLRVMMSPLLSTLRILTALPGPGPRFDQTFESTGRIPVARLLTEAEQTLFENGFVFEADHLLCIQDELEQVYTSHRSTPPAAHLNISDWKNKTIKLVMVEIMRFSEESYQRYLVRESAMVQAKLGEFAAARPQVVVVSCPGLKSSRPSASPPSGKNP
jgi:hypothetical protein